MFTYLFKRIAFAIISLFIIVTIVFFAVHSLSGSPLQKNQSELADQFLERQRQVGLLDPLSVQYGRYLSSIFDGSFGVYYGNSSQTIPNLVFRAMPYTLVLMSIVYVCSIVVGMFLGVLAARYRGKTFDSGLNFVITIVQAIPLFVWMPLIVAALANASITTRIYALDASVFTPEKLVAYIWPILILTLVNMPTYFYFTRNELNDALNQDYIKVALSKGNSYRQTIVKHGLRNSMIAIIYILVPNFIMIISGSVMAEIFFGIPGFAQLLVSSTQNRQYNVVLFQAFFFSAFYYGLSIISDFLLVLIDPRIKLANEEWDSWVSMTKFYLLRKFRLLYLTRFVFKAKFVVIQKNSPLYENIKKENLIDKNRLMVSELMLEEADFLLGNKYALIDNNYYKIVQRKKDENATK